MQQRLARAGRRAFQAGPRLLLATIGRHGIVDIVPGAEHGFLECQRCLLGLRLAQPQPAAQLAALEERDLQRRAHAEDAGAVGVQVAQLQRLQPDVARQGDARIEIALGHADRGHRGMQARLRLADVGTPLGQLAGQAHRHPHRTARDGRQRFQPRVQRAAAGPATAPGRSSAGPRAAPAAARPPRWRRPGHPPGTHPARSPRLRVAVAA